MKLAQVCRLKVHQLLEAYIDIGPVFQTCRLWIWGTGAYGDEDGEQQDQLLT
jgi:hypothetical protein